MPEHNILTDPELHEPKGVASAAQEKVYVADGAGSGTWSYLPTGWGFYQDAGTSQTFNTTATKIQIDGAGTLSDNSYLPRDIRGTGELWDTINNKITPIKEGDVYDVRVSIPVTSKTGTPDYVDIQFDIGGSSTPTNVVLSARVDATITAGYNIVYSLPIFASSGLLNNGGQIFLSTNTGSIVVDNPSLFISRTHSEVSV